MREDLTKRDGARAAARPRVDVYENEAELLLVADLPGVAQDRIEVRWEAGELRIEGRRVDEAPGNPLAEEYRPADFARSFALPEVVDPAGIEAELRDGVLRVHLPKSTQKRARKIDVRAS